MTKLEINKRQKKEALLSTAFDLFLSKGITKTSISDIVQKAGVAKGTFYLYFKDKYDLRNYLIADKANQLFLFAYKEMEEENIQGFDEQMIFMVDHILDQLNKDKTLLSFIAKHLSWGVFKNVLTSQKDTSQTSVYELYEKLLRDSGYTFREPEIMIYMIIELASGTSYNCILYEQPVSLEEFKPYLYQDIRYIVQAHKLTADNPNRTEGSD